MELQPATVKVRIIGTVIEETLYGEQISVAVGQSAEVRVSIMGGTPTIRNAVDEVEASGAVAE